MVFIFLYLDDLFYLMWWSNINVIYDSSCKFKQKFARRRKWFYYTDFEQNILFAPFQLYKLLSNSEILNWKLIAI